uniref:Uncharacterized protein n=1 Tax=Sander lucioperca TaxID=283035 RepID=A0A8C9Y1N1_SANLU
TSHCLHECIQVTHSAFPSNLTSRLIWWMWHNCVRIFLMLSFGFVSETKLLLFKLISITTDGAPAMMGRTSGFIALCKESESFPDILNYHCIIHHVWKDFKYE